MSWSRRSLRDFGVQPVGGAGRDATTSWCIDHPFCGPGAGDRLPARPRGRCSRPTSTRCSGARASARRPAPTTMAAASGACRPTPPRQVASYRPDLLAGLGAAPAADRGRRARARPQGAAGRQVAGAAVGRQRRRLPRRRRSRPISAARSARRDDRMLAGRVFDAVLDYLAELRRALPSRARPRCNPIAIYDAMSSGDEIVYVPFGFGYVNYSRARGAAAASASPPSPARARTRGGRHPRRRRLRHLRRAAPTIDAAVTLSHLAAPAGAPGRRLCPATAASRGLRAAWTDPEVDREARRLLLRHARDDRQEPISARASTASSRPSSIWASSSTPGSPARATAPA